MQKIAKIINKLSYASCVVSTVFIFGMLLLTVADVIGRGVFTHPILGTYETSKYMLVVIILFGIAWAEHAGHNIRVDMFIGKLPPTGRLIADGIFTLITIALFVFVIWQGWEEGFNAYAVGTNSDILHIPEYPFRFVICFGAFLLVLELILKFINIAIFRIQYVGKEVIS